MPASHPLELRLANVGRTETDEIGSWLLGQGFPYNQEFGVLVEIGKDLEI